MPDYNLRTLQGQDRSAVVDLIRCFHNESPYRDATFSDDKTHDFIDKCLGGVEDVLGVILEADGEVVGFLGAACTDCLFSDERTSIELAWYVYPEHRRGQADKMRGLYEYWAVRKRGCKYVHLVCLEDENAPRMDKYYKRKGYHKVENGYIKAFSNGSI